MRPHRHGHPIRCAAQQTDPPRTLLSWHLKPSCRNVSECLHTGNRDADRPSCDAETSGRDTRPRPSTKSQPSQCRKPFSKLSNRSAERCRSGSQISPGAPCFSQSWKLRPVSRRNPEDAPAQIKCAAAACRSSCSLMPLGRAAMLRMLRLRCTFVLAYSSVNNRPTPVRVLP